MAIVGIDRALGNGLIYMFSHIVAQTWSEFLSKSAFVSVWCTVGASSLLLIVVNVENGGWRAWMSNKSGNSTTACSGFTTGTVQVESTKSTASDCNSGERQRYTVSVELTCLRIWRAHAKLLVINIELNVYRSKFTAGQGEKPRLTGLFIVNFEVTVQNSLHLLLPYVCNHVLIRSLYYCEYLVLCTLSGLILQLHFLYFRSSQKQSSLSADTDSVQMRKLQRVFARAESESK